MAVEIAPLGEANSTEKSDRVHWKNNKNVRSVENNSVLGLIQTKYISSSYGHADNYQIILSTP